MSQENFNFLKQTREVFRRIERSLQLNEQFSNAFWRDLEENLLTIDIGPQTSRWLIQRLQQLIEEGQIHTNLEVFIALRQELVGLLGKMSPLRRSKQSSITVMAVMGDSGSGKTVTTAKLAYRLKNEGRNVLVMATEADRSTGIGALKVRAEQISIPIVLLNKRSDIGLSIYHTLQSAIVQGVDVILIDTSGYHGTDQNSINELKVLISSVQKVIPDAPHELLMMLDLTKIHEELPYIRELSEQFGVTGIIISKVDKITKVGGAFTATDDLGVPIKFLGTGESNDQLVHFDPESFIKALFEDEE